MYYLHLNIFRLEPPDYLVAAEDPKTAFFILREGRKGFLPVSKMLRFDASGLFTC